ncbi:T9SS type A sorting domain-containing protein [Flavitalea sp.]|nr:T9SS type A sorting domain-containing protein [Flavitalea sp.]
MKTSIAQPGFYIPKSGKIFFTSDSATIFANVFNDGQFGIGKNATVNFKGLTWTNDIASSITDESSFGNGVAGQGGLLRFLVPDTRLTGNLPSQQYLTGGYNAATRTGPMFANLQINNPSGLRLIGGSTKIMQQLEFKSGHVFTSDNILVVGHNFPGVISGYNESRFVVTGGKVDGGMLLREKIEKKHGHVSFPVGSTINGYSPASIYLRSDNPDDFYVAVSDTVLRNAITGALLNEWSVNKTWQTGKLLRPGQDDVELSLQHQVSEEGSKFNSYRLLSYISHYNSSGWDTGRFKIAPSAPGIITTGPGISTAAMNSRSFSGEMGAQSYFTKISFAFADSARTNLLVNGFRLNSELVKLAWTTRPEINIKYFVVQRRFDNQVNWKSVDSMDSKAINGYSFSYLNYTLNDPNKYSGISYYRIVMIDYQGNRMYSDIIVIDGQSKPSRFAIWPNPSTGRFMVSIDKLQKIKTVVIWNAIGQRIRETDVTGKELVEMYLYTPGTYIIGFISDNKLIESRKLVITGW